MDRREFIATCALATSAIATASMAMESVPAWPTEIQGYPNLTLEYRDIDLGKAWQLVVLPSIEDDHWQHPYENGKLPKPSGRQNSIMVPLFRICKNGENVPANTVREDLGSWEDSGFRNSLEASMIRCAHAYSNQYCSNTIMEGRMMVLRSEESPSLVGIVILKSDVVHSRKPDVKRRA